MTDMAEYEQELLGSKWEKQEINLDGFGSHEGETSNKQ